MTNYDYLITLQPQSLTHEIIDLCNRFGGNSELLLRYLQSEYVGVKTVRDILNSNYSGSKITFRYRSAIYECVSVENFLQRYGLVNEHILNNVVKNINSSKSGNKTLIL